MLYFSFKNRQGEIYDRALHWDNKPNVEKLQTLGRNSAMGEQLLEIQADGDELRIILSQCQNLPRTSHPVQFWHGDLAKFIAANVNFEKG